MVTSGQPTHEPSTYIYVLKGIQEYILHMLYCRLISNSAAMALEEIAVGAYGCILPSRKATWINAVSQISSRARNSDCESSFRIIECIIVLVCGTKWQRLELINRYIRLL